MAFGEELQERLDRYLTEYQSYDERMARLRSLIDHVKALLEEETRDAQYPLPATLPQNGVDAHQGPATGQGVSVPDVVMSAIPAGALVRFNVIRDTVRERLWPDKDTLHAGKLVAAALSRAIDKGSIERVGRGLYRRHVASHQPINVAALVAEAAMRNL